MNNSSARRLAVIVLSLVVFAVTVMTIHSKLRLHHPRADRILNSILISAVSNRDLPATQHAISAGADVNTRCGTEGENDTCLMEAASNNDVDIVRLLLANGANVLDQNDDGETAITKAFEFHNLQIGDLLLEHCTNIDDILKAVLKGDNRGLKKRIAKQPSSVNVTDRNRCTPLILASILSNTFAVSTLLNAGANPNLQDRNGFTPLFQASWKGNLNIVKLLLSHGADKHHQCRGYTCIAVARIYSHSEIVNLLK